MPILDFIISVFCLVDDECKKLPYPIRKGGFHPALSDSEVITIEIIGEFLGIDTDKGIWVYFKNNWLTLFPKKYYGFHGHLVINSIGVITAGTFTAANIDERDVCPELMQRVHGLVLGDKGFIRPSLKFELLDQGVYLETSVRANMQEDRPNWFIRWMIGKRRLVETVIGQLADRFNIEKIRARDLWHQSSRFWRKLLAHTICIKINLEIGNEPLQFEALVN
jgi:hypothetical protein